MKNLSLKKFLILENLYLHEYKTTNELTKELKINQPNMHKYLKNLKEQGYININHDFRPNTVKLTMKANTLLQTPLIQLIRGIIKTA